SPGRRRDASSGKAALESTLLLTPRPPRSPSTKWKKSGPSFASRVPRDIRVHGTKCVVERARRSCALGPYGSRGSGRAEHSAQGAPPPSPARRRGPQARLNSAPFGSARLGPARPRRADMLPSLQESLDGDDKELESSEEGGGSGGGSVEDRRPERPPSSHFCLYAYHGSRSPTQRGDSDDGNPSSLTLETPPGADFRFFREPTPLRLSSLVFRERHFPAT
uniref:Chromosome 17 open reading frame 75 n=1 Tax=Vombatus ursinus TaxID=29139 RepID=A0A4X2KUL8_VOMUR